MKRKAIANIKDFKGTMKNVTLKSIDKKWELADALKTSDLKQKQVDGLYQATDEDQCDLDEKYNQCL